MTTDTELMQVGSSLDLRKYAMLLWRWLWLIVLCAVLFGGAAYIVSRATRPVYSASVILLINTAASSSAGTDTGSLSASQQLARTYVELLRTTDVLDKVVSKLELPYSSAKLAGRVLASVVANTQLIKISIEDTDPLQASTIVNTLAQVFQEINQEQQLSRYANLSSSLTIRIQQVENDIAATQADIAAMPSKRTAEEEARLDQLQATLSQYNSSYSSLLNSLSQVRLSEAQTMSQVSVAQKALVPTSPIRPRTLNNTLLAAVVGAMLAAGVALLIEYLDDTIKTPDDIEQVAHTPLLGLIARIEGTEPAGMLITALTPRSPISEAYRVMRTNIQYSSVDKPLSRLLITSTSPTEGKSTTVANLAVVLAQSGNRVVVVDADLRRPTQHKYFSLSNAFGVTTAILESQSPVEQHLQATAIENLRVMTSGPLPPNPAELLDSQRLEQVLVELQEQADIIVMDSPPLLSVTDASLLSRRVDGTLLVIDASKTKRAFFARALGTLQSVNANLLGVVLNRIIPSRSGYYSYYYYYHHYYAEDGTKHKSRNKRTKGWRWPWQRAKHATHSEKPAV
ncbi:MAG: tyrosine-protein kinase domain-containing protein [Anaerolineae bacterium]